MKPFHIADLFCGAGGTSSGAIEAASSLGYTPHLTAINHWPVAIDTHLANHPHARTLCTGIDAVDPRQLYRDTQLDLLWASPECTHHSIARGGKPIQDQSRATAWCVIRWAEAIRPAHILVENVPEFQTWGPLDAKGRPLKSKKGHTFQAWINALQALGYKVAHRLLCAADYGDPTTRTRLFIQAVRGRRRIVWPNPTHTQNPDLIVPRRWAPASQIIDWSLPSSSIYTRKKPLAPKTLARILAGLNKFGLQDYIVAWDHTSGGPSAGLGDIASPISTIVTKARHGLASPFLIELRGTSPNQIQGSPKSLSDPCGTVTANGTHHGLIQPYLVSFYGNGQPHSIEAPTPTVTTKDRFGLVRPILEIQGTRYLLDLHFRMLQPHELAAAQGFPLGYTFTGTKTNQVKQIGNAVPRRLARALVAAVVSQNEDVTRLVEAEETTIAAA
jgi:DNA (cytosine-5)-methyltransferase 1